MENIEGVLLSLKAETDLIRQQGMWAGFRWPEEIKKSVRELHRNGISGSRLVQETGICIETVRAWCGEAKPKKPMKKLAFRPLKLKPEVMKLLIVNERGIRIEGLSLSNVKELLFTRAL